MHSSRPPSLSDAVEPSLGRRIALARRSIEVGGRTVNVLHPANADDLISEADFVRDDRLPYWADIWPSSLVLARVVASLPADGRSLIELGCGVGVVAIAATDAGFDTTATDYYEIALAFAEHNVRLATRKPVRTFLLDWRAIPDDLRRYDVVVASDVLYEDRYPPLVAAAIARTLAPGGMALIADPGRVAAPAFPVQLERHGLAVTAHDRVPWREGPISQTIEILTVQWSPRAAEG